MTWGQQLLFIVMYSIASIFSLCGMITDAPQAVWIGVIWYVVTTIAYVITYKNMKG